MVRARATADRTNAAHRGADAPRGNDATPAVSTEPVIEAVSVEKCINCRFYDRRHAKPLDGKAPLWGQCRRHAPQLNPNPLTSKAYVVEGIWPLVRDDDWCGEWKIIVHVVEESQPNAPATDDLPPLPSRDTRAEAALGDD
jgi:hypothetical protein